MSDQFVSVPTMIKGMFRMVTESEMPRFCAGVGRAGGSFLREEALAHARQSDTVMRFLVELDRKLDTILGLLQRESLEADFPEEGRIVQLSGAALVFECGYELKKGDTMELLMFLEEYPLRLLSVKAHVRGLHSGKVLTGPSNKAYDMGYVCMGEEDREAVIRFVFSENRKLIRQQKNGEEV